MKTLFFAAALTVAQVVSAQIPAIEWARCYGGSDGEVVRCIQQTTDGGYLAVGNAGSNDGDVYKNAGSEDAWIVKLNGAGDTLWSRVLGGTQLDFAMSAKQTLDGGYIVAVQSNSNNGDFTGGSSGNYDCWMIKYTPSGGLEWKKRFGGSGNDNPRDLLLTADSGYLVAGISSSKNGGVWGNHGSSDYWLLRLNKTGDTVWSRCYGGSGNDQAFSIQQTTDNGYILLGQSDSKNGDVKGNHGGTDYWVVKINRTGDTLWTRSFGGKENDYGQTVLQTSDGGYLLGGGSLSGDWDVTGHHGDSTKADIWVVKLDNKGDIEWQISLGGTQNEALYGSLLAFSMLQTTEGGYLVASFSGSSDGDVTGNNGNSDAWLVMLTDSGKTEWQKNLGGTANDYAYSVRETTDGGFVVAGMAGTSSGDIIGNKGGVDFWVIKLGGKTSKVAKPEKFRGHLYPNPANNEITLDKTPAGARIKIFDLHHRILSNTITTEENATIAVKDFVNGVYFIQIEFGSMVHNSKFLIER
ncbi:MAG: T9SS type A sorting domain-containing protein [Bacteroidetes bacterium]|nr:T9SS type A sorting domain-containing protein [Bacteroidota bacterium]